MAAPHVTGTVALMFEASPRRLRIDETRNMLLQSADKVPPSDEYPDRVGIGYLDIEAAVEAARAAVDRAASPQPRRQAPAAGEARTPAAPPAAPVAAAPAASASSDSASKEHAAEAEIAVEPHAQVSSEFEWTEAVSAALLATRNTSETASQRNFILLSGGPGPFATKDVEHDKSWANYVTPPLLIKNLAASDETITWMIYRKAYEDRWSSDESSSVSARKKAVEDVKKQGFTSYVDLLEARAKRNAWKLHWLGDAADFWTQLGKFPDQSISRLWYWGHARNDLWLTLTHLGDANASAAAPASSEIITVASIDDTLSSRWATPDAKHVCRFVGCNTRAFAERWTEAFDVWSEGVVGKVSFVSLSKTGGEPCLVAGARVLVFGAGSMQTCKALAFEAADALEAGEAVEAAEMEEPLVAAEAVESVERHPGEIAEAAAITGAGPMPEVAYAEAQSVPSPLRAAVDAGEALVRRADRAIAEVASGAGLSPRRRPAEWSGEVASSRRDVTELFDAFAYPRVASRSRAAKSFDAVALPGEMLATPLRAGDVLVRRAEGERAHIAVIASESLLDGPRARQQGWRQEAAVPGRFAHVVEGGERPHCSADRFARRVTDDRGRVLPNQVVLRPRPLDTASELADATSSLEQIDPMSLVVGMTLASMGRRPAPSGAGPEDKRAGGHDDTVADA